MNLPLIFTSSGPQPTPPSTLYAALIQAAVAQSPGVTAQLPGSMLDDITGTDVGALIAIDQARVDAINSVAPSTANPYLLNQFSQQFGLSIGQPSNATVYVVFTGPSGTVIAPGFIVSDGTNQYMTSSGGVVPAAGLQTSPILFTCTNANIFPIPANTVSTLVTTIPGVAITCTNPVAGTSASAQETVESYRARLLQAYQVAVSTTPAYLRSLLQAVPGVVPRLVSIVQNGTLWEVIVGGGDEAQVAYAILQGVASPGLLTGASSTGTTVTAAIYDYPDTYSVVFVTPSTQTTTVAVTWNTTIPNFTDATAVNQYIIGATSAYINGIAVGQPLNILVLIGAIQQAVSSVLDAPNLSTLSFAFVVNGTPTVPTAGTFIISGSAEAYFYCPPSGVTSAQG